MTLVHSDRMLWLDSIATHAKSIPQQTAIQEICHDDGKVCNTTYAALESRSDHASAMLHDLAPPGSSILLCSRNGSEFLISLIGAFKAGLSVLPVSPASTVHELREITRSVKPSVLIRSRSSPQRLDDSGVHEIDIESLSSGSTRSIERPDTPPSLMLHPA